MHIQADPSEFLAAVSDASGQIRPEALCGRLRITPEQLAESIGVSPEALTEEECATSPTTQARLRDLAEIIGRVQSPAGSELSAFA